MERKTPLARSRKKMKRSPLKKRNPERLARLRAEQFGEYAEYIRQLPCCSCGAAPPSEPSHVRTRGAGGKMQDQVPHCRRCHDLYEHMPYARHEFYAPVAASLWALYQLLMEEPCEA
jgi:hypothetical protein